jgi:hypothetical protein
VIHSSDNKPGQGYQGYQGHVSLLQVPSWDESGSYAQKYNSWYGQKVTLTNDAKGNSFISFKNSNSFKYFKAHCDKRYEHVFSSIGERPFGGKFERTCGGFKWMKI